MTFYKCSYCLTHCTGTSIDKHTPASCSKPEESCLVFFSYFWFWRKLYVSLQLWVKLHSLEQYWQKYLRSSTRPLLNMFSSHQIAKVRGIVPSSGHYSPSRAFSMTSKHSFLFFPQVHDTTANLIFWCFVMIKIIECKLICRDVSIITIVEREDPPLYVEYFCSTLTLLNMIILIKNVIQELQQLILTIRGQHY